MAARLPTQTVGKSDLRVTRIALGCMGMSSGKGPGDLTTEIVKNGVAAFEAALEAGITFFDHADIYGGGACESVFQACLAAVPGIREKIVIATKCGIGPNRYNLSGEYIKKSIDASLTRLGTDYVDIYQMHRPDPLAHPAETAAALRDLLVSGKVHQIAVSNYYPEQLRALQYYLGETPIVSNQIEISLLRPAPFYEGWMMNDSTSRNGQVGDGVLDQCMAMDITPLAWSPLGKSYLSGKKPVPADHPRKERIEGVIAELNAKSEKYNATPSQIALAWLLKHPAGVIPLVGSNNPAHIQDAAGAVHVDLSREDWYELFAAAWGHKMP